VGRSSAQDKIAPRFSRQTPERKMTTGDSSRRDFFLAAAASAAAGVAALAPGEAVAYQGNMENALGALQSALDSLLAATPNKGGHRERAIHLIQQAMWQVQAGINFAAAHGGGGY
jgi:hypothetical protein